MPFSKRYPGEFLAREENHFEILLDKIRLFYNQTRADIQDGKVSRRKLSHRFSYEEEIKNLEMNQAGITTAEVTLEFNDMLSGCIRHQDPTTAFNVIPSPLFDIIAGTTLASLYNANPCWDFISGKLCLYEKKIVRMLGSLVDWADADGFVITGGKQALAYAIKSGIERARNGDFTVIDDYVVICSEHAHYSIEHVCNYLGISNQNCLRVHSSPTGEMDLKALRNTLERAISEGKKVAAIIAVAGATINLLPDPILLIKQIIDQVVLDFQMSYTPYIHVDSVITWAWLAFQSDLSSLEDDLIHPNIVRKIKEVLSKLSGIKYVDSFAADFHKTGFCPYAAGVFIAKNSTDLSRIAAGGYVVPENPSFGEVEPLRQTFENSRSSLPIVSIWIAIRRMGLEGLRQFILYQLEVCETFKRKIRERYNNHFEILNDHSLGWEIVLKPHFCEESSWDDLQNSSPDDLQNYISDCYAFLNESWYFPLDDESLQRPIIGFIPKYSRKGHHEKSLPAFLIHPTSLHYDESTIDEMLGKIIDMKTDFESKYSYLRESSTEMSLQVITPPR